MVAQASALRTAGTGSATQRFLFRRDWLPAPAAYYRSQGLQLRGSGMWRSACCPFHDDRHPSLRVRIDCAAFRCMACGARGRDVLAFHRRRTGLGFIDAATALGAYEVPT